MKGIGLCAIFSRQGDWAFDYALSLARKHKAKLNVFHFLESPYAVRRDVVFVDANKEKTAVVTPAIIAEKDKELRLKYDERLGDYVDVGFRLCEGSDEWELKKCFKRGDYEVLVIGYQAKGADFGGTTTIEEFAGRFHGPLILVGPESPDVFHINEKAKALLDQLDIPEGKWEMLNGSK
ncbi:MAG: universal stress protein [Desulfomonile tiedjei]|nr:universal stress protein [Desulfomonile tiedjei]